MENDKTVDVPTKLKKTRRLKMAYNPSPTDGRKVAAIRFSGLYLEALGFTNDGYFDLTINDDMSLTIRPAKEVDNQIEIKNEVTPG